MAPVSDPEKDMDAPDGGEFWASHLFFVDFWRHCGRKAKKLADTLASSDYVNTPAIRLRSLTPKVPAVVCLPAFSTVKGVLLRFKQEDMKVATRTALNLLWRFENDKNLYNDHQ